MPLADYFKGKGNKVMASMSKEYGEKEGKKVFYATANKKGLTAKASKKGEVNAGPSKKLKMKHGIK